MIGSSVKFPEEALLKQYLTDAEETKTFSKEAMGKIVDRFAGKEFGRGEIYTAQRVFIQDCIKSNVFQADQETDLRQRLAIFLNRFDLFRAKL